MEADGEAHIERRDQFAPRFGWLLDLGYQRIPDEETRWGIYESPSTRIALFHAELDQEVSLSIWPRTPYHWSDDWPWQVSVGELADALDVPPPRRSYADDQSVDEVFAGIADWLRGPGRDAVEGRSAGLLLAIAEGRPDAKVSYYRYPPHRAWCEAPDGERQAAGWVSRLPYGRLIGMARSEDPIERAIAALAIPLAGRREGVDPASVSAEQSRLIDDPDEEVRRNTSVACVPGGERPSPEALLRALAREMTDGPSSALYGLIMVADVLPPDQLRLVVDAMQEVTDTRPGARDQVELRQEWILHLARRGVDGAS